VAQFYQDLEFKRLKIYWTQLKIELLTEASISKSKFEGIARDVLVLTLDTVLDAV